MNKKYHDEELRVLFQQHKKEIPDAGFSKNIRHHVALYPERTPLWHYGVFAIALLCAVIVMFAFNLFPSIAQITASAQHGTEILMQLLLAVLLNKYFYLAALLALFGTAVFMFKRFISI